MARSSIALAAALLACGGAACSSGSKPACGPRDAGVIEVNVEAPAGCPPPQANELGIGTPCTMCGNQCPSPLRCTCDPYLGVTLVGAPCVCTKVQAAPVGSTDPCGPPLPTDFCGSNATCCAVLTSAAYCVPNVCLIGGQCIVFTPLDAGTDAEADAGTD